MLEGTLHLGPASINLGAARANWPVVSAESSRVTETIQQSAWAKLNMAGN
jgi:hypothetical protein